MADLHALLRSLDPRERVTQTPRWIDRVAAGVLPAAPGVLTAQQSAAVSARRREIETLRERRREARSIEPAPQHFQRDFRWHGINMFALCDRRTRKVRYKIAGTYGHGHSTPRDAARALFRERVRCYGVYQFRASHAPQNWVLSRLGQRIASWPRRPARAKIARAIVADRARVRATRPDPSGPDTLGWRAWLWSPEGYLVSPHQGTPWLGPDLRCDTWVEANVLRGEAGIHARRMPHDWRRACWSDHGQQEGPSPGTDLVTGVVERYGHYMLGTTGWRAEWVVIRALQAPSIAIQDALLRAYPDVPVYLSPAAAAAKEAA